MTSIVLLSGLLSLLLPTCRTATASVPQQPVAAAFGLSAPAIATCPPLPQPLASFGCAADGDKVFVYGGHIGKAHAHSRQNQVGTMLCLDRSRTPLAWVELGHGPLLQSAALICHGGSVFRIGGMTARNVAGQPDDLWSTAEVACFDVARGAWSTRAALPEARSSLDAVLVGHRAIVIGGWQLAGSERRWLDTAWSLDLADPAATWQPLPQPPFRRRALAVAAVGERVYALGGLDDGDEMSTQVDVLDLASSQWQRGPDLPGRGFAVAADGHGGELFASGRDGDLWRLDEGRWQTMNTLAIGRFFHRLVPAGQGALLAVGGASDRHLATCEVVATSRDSVHVQQWSLSWSHPARNRQGFALLDDTLFVAGGNCGSKQHDFEPHHFTAETCAIDLRTMQVAPRAALPAPRQSLGMIACAGSLLALGGFAHADGGGRAQASVATYGAKAGAWNAATATLPEPRTQFGLVRAASSYWVLGGIDFAPDRKGNEFVFPASVLHWDGAATSFTAAPTSLPRARRAFGCAVQNDRIWLVGGMREEFEPVPEVDVFEPATTTWTTGPCPTHPRISPFLLAIDDHLVLVGGTVASDDGSAPARTLAVLAPGAAAWHELELPVEPPLLGAVVWRDRLLLASRANERLLLTTVQLPAPTRRP